LLSTALTALPASAAGPAATPIAPSRSATIVPTCLVRTDCPARGSMTPPSSSARLRHCSLIRARSVPPRKWVFWSPSAPALGRDAVVEKTWRTTM
jgi:hypothetical protein